MLEYALEKFPLHVTLENGLKVEVRPLISSDQKAFQEFHLQIPEEERLFIKHRITDQALFHQWCTNIDYELNLPLLAIADEKIVADGTLHQRPGGWKRHIGLVSVLTHPDYRGLGLVGVLIAEIITIAKHCGLIKLETEFNGEREVAIRSFAENSFEELARIPKYVQDMQGHRHDYVLMGRDLIPDEELTGAGD